MPWVFSPTWNSVSLTDCRGVLAELGRSGHGGGGACWGVIRERWLQLLFGFYPSELYWRPILAFILLGLALAPVLFDKASRKLLYLTAIYPFLCFWLIWGGSIWFPVTVFSGFIVSYLGYVYVNKIFWIISWCYCINCIAYNLVAFHYEPFVDIIAVDYTIRLRSY